MHAYVTHDQAACRRGHGSWLSRERYNGNGRMILHKRLAWRMNRSRVPAHHLYGGEVIKQGMHLPLDTPVSAVCT
eukprot:1138745-Pelagomonas_calceolata.AAC.2